MFSLINPSLFSFDGKLGEFASENEEQFFFK